RRRQGHLLFTCWRAHGEHGGRPPGRIDLCDERDHEAEQEPGALTRLFTIIDKFGLEQSNLRELGLAQGGVGYLSRIRREYPERAISELLARREGEQARMRHAPRGERVDDGFFGFEIALSEHTSGRVGIRERPSAFRPC